MQNDFSIKVFRQHTLSKGQGFILVVIVLIFSINMRFCGKSISILGLLLSNNIRDEIFAIRHSRITVNKTKKKQFLIYFADGRNYHGGLCDRFKGIISLFCYCLCLDIDFKIRYTFPFDLFDYLQVNLYNWMVDEKDVAKNIREIKYVNLIGDTSIKRLTKLKTKRQLHIYANRDIVSQLNQSYNQSYQWGELFKTLFKPSDRLRFRIEQYQNVIEGKYISVVFRFQNLLGDFQEYQYKALNESEKKILILQCCQAILSLQKRSQIKQILVTSDSQLFLNYVSLKQSNQIYVFPEKVVHLDSVSGESYSVYEKSFLDFYLLSESVKIYSITTSIMYSSEFPLYASKVNNIPFERIII